MVFPHDGHEELILADLVLDLLAIVYMGSSDGGPSRASDSCGRGGSERRRQLRATGKIESRWLVAAEALSYVRCCATHPRAMLRLRWNWEEQGGQRGPWQQWWHMRGRRHWNMSLNVHRSRVRQRYAVRVWRLRG